MKEMNPDLAKNMSPLLNADDQEPHYCRISIDLSDDDERRRFFDKVLDALDRNKDRINGVGRDAITLSELEQQVFSKTEKYVSFKSIVLGRKMTISHQKALLMALKSAGFEVVDSKKFIFSANKARMYGKRQSSMLEFVKTKSLIT